MLKVFITLRITFLPFIYVNAACGYAPWLSMLLKPEIARLLRLFCVCDLVRQGRILSFAIEERRNLSQNRHNFSFIYTLCNHRNINNSA